LFTQANTYSPLDCAAGRAVAALAGRLYPALVLVPKLTDRTRTAPVAIPARATAAMARVLDFMIILPFRFQGTSASALRAGMVRPGTVNIRGECAVAARDTRDHALPRRPAPAGPGSLPVSPPVPPAAPLPAALQVALMLAG
jgi:hypothetical protein